MLSSPHRACTLVRFLAASVINGSARVLEYSRREVSKASLRNEMPVSGDPLTISGWIDAARLRYFEARQVETSNHRAAKDKTRGDRAKFL